MPSVRQSVDHACDACDRLVQSRDRLRVGDADVVVRGGESEVATRCDGDVGILQNAGGKGEAVVGQSRHVTVDIEGAVRNCANREADLGQRRQQRIASQLQLRAALEHGFWYARSAEFLQQPLLQTIVWLRMPGDVIFAAGALMLALFVFRLFVGKARDMVGAVTQAKAG